MASFCLARNLKALKAHPVFNAEVDRKALALLLRHNCIPTPYSIYKGIYKLPPGHILTLNHIDKKAAHYPEPRSYWSLNEVVTAGLADPFVGSETQAINELEAQLQQSVQAQMLADVPLGALLSGGIDSSTIVALMQVHSREPDTHFYHRI